MSRILLQVNYISMHLYIKNPSIFKTIRISGILLPLLNPLLYFKLTISFNTNGIKSWKGYRRDDSHSTNWLDHIRDIIKTYSMMQFDYIPSIGVCPSIPVINTFPCEYLHPLIPSFCAWEETNLSFSVFYPSIISPSQRKEIPNNQLSNERKPFLYSFPNVFLAHPIKSIHM